MGWADQEMGGADFGDKRLNNRGVRILDTLGGKPNVSIPAASKGWGETLATYRFMDNPKVTMEKVFAPHLEATLERVREYPVVLCVEDTTILDFTTKPEIKGLGPLSYPAEHGLFLHPTLAVTPERVPLGVLDTRIIVRDPETLGKKKANRPIEEKESVRWLEGYDRVNELQAQTPNTKLVYVADRECDIYEFFTNAYTKQNNEISADWLIRAAYDRKLDGETGKLWNQAEKAPILGKIQFEKPRTKEGPARRVTQTLRAARVTLYPPYRKDRKLDAVEVTAILALEENPPDGEEPLEWLLLTNLTVETLEQAAEKLQWYLSRWEVEIYFRILKSGCKVEELQLKDKKRLEPALAFYMIIAWRVAFLVMLGRECPELPADVVFEEAEWKAAFLVIKQELPPNDPPNLQEMIKMVAGLGGFLGRKGDGFPGPKTMWIGLQRLKDFVIGIEAQKAVGGDHSHPP